MENMEPGETRRPVTSRRSRSRAAALTLAFTVYSLIMTDRSTPTRDPAVHRDTLFSRMEPEKMNAMQVRPGGRHI